MNSTIFRSLSRQLIVMRSSGSPAVIFVCGVEIEVVSCVGNVLAGKADGGHVRS